MASVPVRAKNFFRILAARKLGREQKGRRSGVGVGRGGNACRLPYERRAFFAFWPRENWGESKKVDGAGWVWGEEGTLAGKLHDSEKRRFFTVDFIR